MSVYKEFFREFQDLVQSQKRIYPDACDYGIKVVNAKDPVCVRVGKLINEYKHLVEDRTENINVHYSTCTVKLFIPWEVDNGMTVGTCIELRYYKTAVKNHGILSIDLNNEKRYY